ncbi:ATP-binding protein [Enterobacter mori]|uniref:ATP-binding protein n=1 Tax=Enterobacter mori TaxID=539813 RepID=UPI00402A8448
MNLNAALSTDLLKEGRNKEQFVGRPFYLSYDIARLLVCDAWKAQVKGIPAGCFLLAFYDGEDGVEEAVLLRALSQTKLPTDNDVISSMIEYYKDNLDISGRAGSLKGGKLDEFTRYEFSFSGLECRVLGVFYRTQKGNIEFGADLENFYAANNYTVYKANGDVLEFIVNQRDDGGLVGQDSEFKIGSVRYSSSRRHQSQEENVNVWVNPKDFLGKRSAMFGMTRTGKSNTVKKVIEATEEISRKALILLDSASPETSEFTSSGSPTFPVGQIIFDVNGEYANANRQDSGTAIYDLYKEKVYRYSVLEKNDFKVMKVNFFKDIESGFSLISSYFQEQSLGGDYVNNFIAVSFEKPESTNLNGSEWTRYNRLVAAYKCCLYRAGFKAPNGEKIKFTGAAEINSEILEDRVLDPKLGLTLEEACTWFERVWEQYDDLKFFKDYINKKGYEWANDDLKSMMVFLTTYKLPGKKNQVSGYKKIRVKQLHNLHTTSMDESFEIEIPRLLQQGKIVIVDLSQGEPVVQRLFSEKICRSTFNISMDRFINNLPNNFIQFYFEEAHNLFPKKDDKDLSQIYNRIAKEGAKLHLGMIYATQEVSSISSNILKNTQNWFIAHLNNIDETKELEKYYDFKDFTHSLVNFSATNDKGFVRMKTYTNPFIVPVQIDRFLANKGM